MFLVNLRNEVLKSEMEDPSWYNRPLYLEDMIAGGSLLFMGMFSILLYATIVTTMKKHDKDIVGYRFLISAGIADMMLLFNYGIWPGLTIIFKSEIISISMRHWVQLYLDWAWFSMVWHYTVISWSRWCAIRHPVYFKSQTKRFSYTLCAACYLIAAVQVLATHFQPWYVTFYYEPSSYGMLAENFEMYMTGGQSAMFLTFHSIAIIPPAIFYTWAFILLIQRRKSSILVNTALHHHHNNVESRLLLPCVINLVMFVVGQLVITFGTGEGKWAGWTVMMVFCSNSALNTLLLLICSASIRAQVFNTIGIRRHSYGEKFHDNLIFKNHRVVHTDGKLNVELESRAPSTTDTIAFV